MSNLLDMSFYAKDVHTLAKSLLGTLLVRTLENGQRISGHIVEVEAYAQKGDAASHSFKGKTARNAVMFGPAGTLYVYFIYGKYYCCNVVAGPEGVGDAVLIRAIQPYEGIDLMQKHRRAEHKNNPKDIINLCNGPGKLAQALNITKKENGLDLCNSNVQIYLSKKLNDMTLEQSSRIGINQAKELNWRYYIRGNPCVSKA